MTPSFAELCQKTSPRVKEQRVYARSATNMHAEPRTRRGMSVLPSPLGGAYWAPPRSARPASLEQADMGKKSGVGWGGVSDTASAPKPTDERSARVLFARLPQCHNGRKLGVEQRLAPTPCRVLVTRCGRACLRCRRPYWRIIFFNTHAQTCMYTIKAEGVLSLAPQNFCQKRTHCGRAMRLQIP